MVPTSLSFDRFSDEKPISIGEQFLIEKVRDALIVPDRAYNCQANGMNYCDIFS